MSKKNIKSLLLVEDDAVIALQQKYDLEDYGYRVDHVCSGEEAVNLVLQSNEEYDLILFDINLGSGIDGTEAAKIILESKEIPILFLSSHTERYIVEKTEKITSYGYVVKNSGIIVLDASIKMACKLFDANKTIKESKKEWENIFNAIGQSAIILDSTQTILEANNATLEILGLQRSEIIGRKCYELFHDSNTAADGCPLISLKNSSHSEIRDMRVEALNATFLVSCTPIFDSNGNIEKIIHIAADITERENIHNALIQSENKYKEQSQMLENLFNAIPDIIGVQDLSHNIIRYNKAGIDFFNISPGKKEGLKCYELIGRTEPCEDCATTEVYHTKKIAKVKKFVDVFDTLFEICAYPILDETGELIKVIEHLRIIDE